MIYVPHAGSGLGDAMRDQGYTEADCEHVTPCTVCGHWDGDDNTTNHPCVAEAELEGYEADIPECEGCEMPQTNCCCG